MFDKDQIAKYLSETLDQKSAQTSAESNRLKRSPLVALTRFAQHWARLRGWRA